MQKIKQDVFTYLGYPKDILEKLIHNLNYHYLSFPIHKQNGKIRWIDAPDDELKVIQYAILHRILYKFQPHDAAVGFIKHRSVLYGAKQHLGCQELLTIDIKDFFPSIKKISLYKLWHFMLHQMFIIVPKGTIEIFNTLTTYMGALPQGAPTSPALANLYCIKLDKTITKLAKKYNFIYTRYADDITVSNRDNLYNIKEIANDVARILLKYNFLQNNAKYRIVRKSERMLVTGVVVNKIPGVPKYKWRNLRAKLHNVVVSGDHITKEIYHKLRGQIEWIRNLHPKHGNQLLMDLGKIPLKI